MNRHEVDQLIDGLLDGDLSEADFLRLEAELSIDAVARRAYVDRVALAMLLENEAKSAGASVPVPNNSTSRNLVPLLRWTIAILATAACLVLCVSLGRHLLDSPAAVADPSTTNLAAGSAGPDEAGRPAEEEQASGYAVLIGQAEATWQDNVVRSNGTLLPTGKLQLLSGVIQLELFSGVSIVVEGEANFSVLSSMEMVVNRGKVRAHVPEPAHGFRIRTSQGEVIDLGTEFAVDVSADRSDVHVIEGEVELQPLDGATRRMAGGQAVRLAPNGQEFELQSKQSEFLNGSQLRSRLMDVQQSRRDAWFEYSQKQRRDPRLVAFYQVAMGEPFDRRLPNRVTGAKSDRELAVGEGAVVAAVRAADRWQQAGGALDFSPTGSRVRLSVPGEFGSMTLYCWVRINSLDRWYNSLFLTDGHELHEPHWQIMNDGRLFFSVKKRDQWDASRGQKDKHIYYSPPFWNASLSGQWLMIATVYDIEDRQVTHFLNGESLSQEPIPDEYRVERVSIGNASLCNWGLPERDDPKFAVRNLNGSLDEFALFSAALTQHEIREIYIHGKP